MKRRAMIVAVWIAITIGASSALSCMRVVDLDAPGGLPDAGFGFPDGAADSSPIHDGGLDIEDGSTIGDAFVPDAL
jgi:hypothetical protein